MDNATRTELLKEEYFELQRIYEDFDRRALTIKGWAITICVGGIGIGFQYADQINPLLGLVVFASLLFWVIEAKWKTFQYANSYRIRKIEAHFRGDKNYSELVPLQMYHDWFQSYSNDEPVHDYEKEWQRRSPRKQTFQNAFLSLVFTPYLHIIGLSIAIAIVNALERA